MPPDLQVSWRDLWLARQRLKATTREAGSLPRTTYNAYEQLDMCGSRTSGATADFLEKWGLGLDALSQAGEGLEQWLQTAIDWLQEIDRQMAAAR